MDGSIPLGLQDPPDELEALRDGVLEAADPRRVKRGLAGHRAGAVQGAWSGRDWVLGRVRGKQGVQVTTARLVAGHLESECDCVDTVVPCAHVPAVLAAAMAAAEAAEADAGTGPGRDPAGPGTAPVEWRDHWNHGALPASEPGGAGGETPPPEGAAHLARAPGVDLLEVLGPLYRDLR